MSDERVKQFYRKGAFATYDLLDALSRNPTTILAGDDICAEAKQTILAQADRIEELEAKLAKVISAYRMEALRRRDYTHDAFDRHIAELTGDEDE